MRFPLKIALCQHVGILLKRHQVITRTNEIKNKVFFCMKTNTGANGKALARSPALLLARNPHRVLFKDNLKIPCEFAGLFVLPDLPAPISMNPSSYQMTRKARGPN